MTLTHVMFFTNRHAELAETKCHTAMSASNSALPVNDHRGSNDTSDSSSSVFSSVIYVVNSDRIGQMENPVIGSSILRDFKPSRGGVPKLSRNWSSTSAWE